MLPAVMEWTPKQLELIRKTVASDADDDEFNLFIHTARHVRLDPLRRQIYCFVFNKRDPDKRQMTIVTSIGGYRTIAARTGNYRPDNRAARLTYDDAAVSETNPTGLVRAEVSVFTFMHNEWHEVVGTAEWDEYVPLTNEATDGYDWVDTGEFWPDSGKPKRKKVPRGDVVQKIDSRKTGWTKMPTIMLAKCAEAQALRKAWPDDFSGVYTSDEMDRQEAIELTATEIVEQARTETRLERVGGKDSILFDFSTPKMPKPLIPVTPGNFHERIDEFLRDNTADPAAVMEWRKKNATALNICWALDPDAMLDIKAKLEVFEARHKDLLLKPQAARAALAAAE